MTEVKNEIYRYDDRTYINAPEAKDDVELRNQIKDAGAKWDGGRSCWYYVSGAAKDEEYLKSFQEIDPQTLDKVVTRYLEISKDQLNQDVKDALKSCKAVWDGDNQAWKVKETNNVLPDALSNFKRKNYDELVKRVYLDVPVNVRKDKEKTAGLKWDRSHQAYYTTVGQKDQVASEYKGFPVFTPPTQVKTLYFELPKARTDEIFRNQIKNAGAKWTPTYQAWVITISKEHPLPSILEAYEPVKAENLKKHEVHKFVIPEAEPKQQNSKFIRDELRAAGVKFNNFEKCYEIWIPEGENLPPCLENRQEIQRKSATNAKEKQDKTQGQSHSFH
jgi:hypothetical protein